MSQSIPRAIEELKALRKEARAPEMQQLIDILIRLLEAAKQREPN